MIDIVIELEATCEMAVEKTIKEVADKHGIAPSELARQYIQTNMIMPHHPACSVAMQAIINEWANREYTKAMRPIWAEQYGWPTEKEEKE